MKGIRYISSFAASLSVLALAAAPVPLPAATAAQLNTAELDLAIARAAKTVVESTQTQAPAPVAKGALSGDVDDEDEDDDKCIVKFFEPEVLKHLDYRWDTLVFVQAKLICDDEVGDAELLIEQNDQIVVAQTVSNDQTEVSMLSTTAKLIDEQADTFCVAIARAGSGDTYSVVDQECFHFDFHDDYSWDGKGQE